MHSGDVSIPKIMDVFRSMQGTVVEQMFHNRRTLHDIMEMRQDNICNEVTYLLFFFHYLCTIFLMFILLVVGFSVYIKSYNRWTTTK
jgi:hypothetical protein